MGTIEPRHRGAHQRRLIEELGDANVERKAFNLAPRGGKKQLRSAADAAAKHDNMRVEIG